MAPEKLSEQEIEAGLAKLTGWRRKGTWIERTCERSSFPEAVRAVGEIAVIAEDMQHHPQIIIDYKTLTLRLTTHDVNGLTALDLDAAGRFEDALE